MKPANRTVNKRRVKGRRTRGGWFPSKKTRGSTTTRDSTTSKHRKKKRIVIG